MVGKLVTRPTYGAPFGLDWPADVADFSDDDRPAYRVKCNCRNCSWTGEARFRIGEVIPQWVVCPKCETEELSAHGDFLGRDEITLAEEQEKQREYYEKLRASEERKREIRQQHSDARQLDAPPSPQKRSRFRWGF